MSKIVDWAMELFGLADEFENDDAEAVETAAEEAPAEKSRPRTRPQRQRKTDNADSEKKQKEESSFRFAGGRSTGNGSSTYQSDAARKSNVVNMSSGTSQSGGYAGLNMVIQQPTSYSDAQGIAKHLKDRQPVVVNLESLDKITAQKIVDFLGGAVYALDGRLTKVATGIVVAVPSNMGITGSIKDDFSSGMFAEIDF